MAYVDPILRFISRVLISTVYQLVAIFGFIFIFGLLLYLISRSTRKAFANSGFGKLDIYLTGWIGTPVHETGHAVFCLLFGHRITELKLFAPNRSDGTLGYVNHSFNAKSYYQRVGNFFIGTGPILFGAFLLYVLLYFCLPNFNEISGLISANGINGAGIFELMKSLGDVMTFGMELTGKVFAIPNLSEFTFWLFIYLSFCISSHMQLSLADIKSMWSGFWAILVLFLSGNFLAQLFGFDLTAYIFHLSRLLSTVIGIFILAILISFINLMATYVVLALVYYKKHRRLLPVL
ncbi:MAG: hypothetical protein Q8S54_16595 [Bacteroidota bacterium]|nr:hypothetical protein [Odoribacter sp.]MDP3644790.1 hypothetical protein [Bacteroidota bacterium]